MRNFRGRAAASTPSRVPPLLLGVVIGLLVAGLLVPLVAGDQGATTAGDAIVGAAPAGVDRGASSGGGHGTGAATGDGGAIGSGPTTPGAPDVAGPAGATSGRSRSGTAGAPTATTPRGAATPVARGPGVTDTTIRIGFLLYDLAGAGQAGFTQTGLDPRQQRAAFDAYVREVNESGGIDGRRIEPVYAQFDLLSEDSQRSACLSLTEDHQVFALVGQFFFRSAYLCATREHRRVVIALGSTATSRDVYVASGGLLFTAYPEGDRMMRSFAVELQAAGLLRGRTVGILSDDGFDPGAEASDVLEARLRSLGAKVGRHGHLSADVSTASTQVAVQVQQMRASGVDLVLLLANPVLSAQFGQEASSQRWKVAYAASDWAAMSSEPGQANMPKEYDGTPSFTGLRLGEARKGIPDTPRAAHCADVYARYTGERLDRNSVRWGVAMGYCNFVQLVVLGVKGAGTNLTSAGVSGALQRLGHVEMAQWGDGSFAPGKFGWIDSVRRQHYDAGCGCDVPDGPFHPMRY